MKSYEVQDNRGRVTCQRHGFLRCAECEYIYKLEKQNKRYFALIKDIKNDIELDYTEEEIEEIPLLTVIIEQIDLALNDDEPNNLE